MRPVTVEHVVSQYFASMATEGVVGDISASQDSPEYWVGRYGNYQPFGHAGMDFACPIGTKVRAMADGVVLYAGWGYNLPGTGPVRAWLLYANFPGIVTVIQHPGWIGVYAHLSDNDMAPAGTHVKMGQVIGLSGNTGGVDAHLHVEALVDLSYKTGDGLIYGRTDPSRFFGASAIAPQSADIIPIKKESEVPEYARVTSPPVRRRLSKGKDMTLVTDATNKTTQNFAVLGLGHYDVDLWLRGSGLPAGETITVQFQIIPTGGKPSGYFKQELHGSADGTFNAPATFKMPILKASRLEAVITSSQESAYLEGFSADVYAWKKD